MRDQNERRKRGDESQKRRQQVSSTERRCLRVFFSEVSDCHRAKYGEFTGDLIPSGTFIGVQ